MKVLLIDQASEASMKIQLGVSKTFGCAVIFKNNLDEAKMEMMGDGDDVVAIIVNEKMNEEFKSFLRSFNLKTPLITKVEYIRDDLELSFLEKDIENCLEIMTPIFKHCLKGNKTGDEVYIPIKATSFLNLQTSHLGCDVFIKIKKRGSPDQYVKRLHAEDRFDIEEVEKYIGQGLEEFFIPENQYGNFINVLSIELIKAFKNPAYKDIDRFSIESCAYETSVDRIKLYGVDEITMKLVDESIKSIMLSIEKTDALSNFLNHLKNNESTYAYFHCYLIALLSEKLSSYFEWNSQKAREKLTYLAFFHDITLWDLELVKIHKEELASLPRDKKEMIMNHAQIASETVEKFKVIPFGLSQLVREHHGSKSGIGFPETLSNSISPLSMMFVVIEDFSSAFINLKGNHNLNDVVEIFKKLEQKYTKLTYLQTLKGLKSVVLGINE